MNRLKIVTKYFVKNALGEMFGSSKKKPIFLAVLMIFVLSMVSMPFTIMVGAGYNAFHAAGQEGILLLIIISSGAAVSFFLGIYTIMNVFYFSDDIEVLLPLPIKSSELVIGKFLAVLVNMYIYTAMLVLPLITYGIVSKASLLYYLYFVLALIITPIFPMVLASIICMVLMRFTNLSRHKDAFRMFTGCITLVIIVGFNYLNSGSKSMTQEQALLKFSEGHNSMMSMVSDVFFTNKLTSYALVYNNEIKGLLYILLALILSIVIFIIYSFIGGKLYLKGIIGISESYSKRENVLENGKADKIIKINSPLKALIMKDIRIILRTPTYFINCVAMAFYMPAILGVGMLSRGNIEHIRNLLSGGNTNSYGLVIVGAFVLASMSVMTGGASATALSREGRDFIVSKYIPVSYEIQVYSKIISSLCINGIGAIIAALVLIFIGSSPILFILGILASIGAIILISLFGLFIDFRSPKLEWENEKAMFKKNYMPLLIMFIVLVLSAILIILNIVIRNYIITFGICISFVIIGSFILWKLLFKLAYRIYNRD